MADFELVGWENYMTNTMISFVDISFTCTYVIYKAISTNIISEYRTVVG